MLLFFCTGAMGQKPPKMVFRERILKLGAFSLSQKDTTVVFHYKNEGDSALVIARMYPACTCMVPTYSTEPLMPGDSCSFSVNYTFSHVGPFSNVVTITFSSPTSSQLDLIRVGIEGEVLEMNKR